MSGQKKLSAQKNTTEPENDLDDTVAPPVTSAHAVSGVSATPRPRHDQSVMLAVDGMSCASCVRRVERGVLKLDQVRAAQANFANGTLRISFAGKPNMLEVQSTLNGLGYPLVEHTVDIDVDGMTCASCVRRVEKALAKVPGVIDSRVNLVNGRAQVKSAQGQDNTAAMISALERMGYPARLTQEPASISTDERQKAAQQKRFSQLSLAIVLTVPLVVLGMGMNFLPLFTHASIVSSMGGMVSGLAIVTWIEMLLATLVLWVPGRGILVTGFKALFHRAPEMNTLVGLGAGTAWLYSLIVLLFPVLFPLQSRHFYFEPAGVVITLILLGRYLEARAKGRSNDAIRALMDMQVKQATVLKDGQPVSVDIERIVVGDTLLVRTGERVAVDGEVVDGQGSVDESMLTGEATAVGKSVGDSLYAATITQSGSLTYRATRVGDDTTLAHIVNVVQEAQSSKLPIQSLVDKVSAVFVPIIIGLALLTFIVWWWCGAALALGISVAVGVLVIACPCAMGLATPVSLMVASGRAAQLGILLNEGEALQALRSIRTIAFDKTGTLTRGKPTVSAVNLLNAQAVGLSETEIIRLAASLESHAEHPLAQAIVDYANTNDLSLVAVNDVEVRAGLGILGHVGQHQVAIGNGQLIDGLGMTTHVQGKQEAGAPSDPLAFQGNDAIVNDGQNNTASTFYMAVDGTVVAQWQVVDPLKPEAVEVIHWLQQQGMEVALLSGDQHDTARAIAEQTGISRVLAPLLPEEKLAAVHTLQKEWGRVAFVGDGINDAPALAQSDVGIALGQGADIAMESGDVVLMSDSLWAVVDALRLSRATITNIRQNLGWAFGYNVLLIPLAAGVLYPAFGILLSPMLAALAMACSSILVVTNALRLRTFDPFSRHQVKERLS